MGTISYEAIKATRCLVLVIIKNNSCRPLFRFGIVLSPMLFKETSRIYSKSSVECWFNLLQINWESQFVDKELFAGRELYVSNKIKSIEITDSDATIHYSVTRKEIYYSIIEWNNNSFNIRSSTKDPFLSKIIAVAGFYEIEELIADKIEPIPPKIYKKEFKEEKNNKKEFQNSNSLITRSSGELSITFFGKNKGLILKPYWVNSGKKKESAFLNGKNCLSKEEREQIVKLTVMSKEAGFEFRPKYNDFLLTGDEKINYFFQNVKKNWSKNFKDINFDNESKLMAEGVKEIKIQGIVTPISSDNVNISYNFKLGNYNLNQNELSVLLKNRGSKIKFIKGRGLVGIRSEQINAIRNWRISKTTRDYKWPKYMIYSLWADLGINLDFKKSFLKNSLIKDNTFNDESNENLPGFLRTYQAKGVLRMKQIFNNGGHCLLSDEMGLGKTIQVLSLIHKYSKSKIPSLIVCPASVIHVWKKESSKWYPNLKVEILNSDKSINRIDGTIWLISYSLLRININKLKNLKFEYLIIDEAQYIKNPQAKTSKACYVLKGKYRLAITGTPLENRLLDLWSIFNFLMPGLMGEVTQFEEYMEEAAKKNVNLIERIKKQINPFLIRRLKEIVAKDLPPKTELDLMCPLENSQKKIYINYLNNRVSSSNLNDSFKDNYISFFALLTRLRQISCDPGIIEGVKFESKESGKVKVLISKLNECFGDSRKRKVVIFSQFVKFINRLDILLRKEFKDIDIYKLTGSTRNRSKPISKFQDSNQPSIILVSLKAGGTGVTLNSADYLFLMDPWWNPAVENQAIDRVHRIGQKSPVFIFRMISEGTIEERIQILKSKKKELFDSTFQDMKVIENIQDYFGDLNTFISISKNKSN